MEKYLYMGNTVIMDDRKTLLTAEDNENKEWTKQVTGKWKYFLRSRYLVNVNFNYREKLSSTSIRPWAKRHVSNDEEQFR